MSTLDILNLTGTKAEQRAQLQRVRDELHRELAAIDKELEPQRQQEEAALQVLATVRRIIKEKQPRKSQLAQQLAIVQRLISPPKASLQAAPGEYSRQELETGAST